MFVFTFEILIPALPLIKADALWSAMPLTELTVAVFAVFALVYYTKDRFKR